MELIDSYVHEIGGYLPGRMRTDVQAELRSLLMESLDERARSMGRPADAELEREVVRAFGAPRDVAARYVSEPRYLIGPRLFPVYLGAIKIMVFVIGVVFIVLVCAGFLRQKAEPQITAWAVRMGASLVSATLFNLGLLTLVFATVERTQRADRVGGKAWDPATLRSVHDRDRISTAGQISKLWAILATAVLFNFFPQRVGGVVIGNTDVQVLPLLLPGFSVYLPLLNAAWTLAFVLSLVVVRQGRWRSSTRWADVSLAVFNGAILTVIIAGPPVFEYDRYAKVVLGIVLAVTVIESCVRLFRLLTRKPDEPFRLAAGVERRPT